MKWIVLALCTLLAAPPLRAEVESVETPLGLARIEGDIFEEGQALVIGEHQMRSPNDLHVGAQIEGEAGPYLLVYWFNLGNGCFGQYAFVDVSGADPRMSDLFGTCGGASDLSWDGASASVTIASPLAAEGAIRYAYDGIGVGEMVLGAQPSHSPPVASARNWIGHCPSELFRASDWRDALVGMMGEAAYVEAQQIGDLCEAMESDGTWVSGITIGNRGMSGQDVAVALNLSDRRLLVAMFSDGQSPRLWGDPAGSIPWAILETLTRSWP